jgi:hypothetical protein
MQRTAQCLCGSLRAVASGEPRFNNICSCRACQRRTGSVIHAGAYFLMADVRCEGPSKIYNLRGDSGREVHLHFCPECGTSVYWHADRAPGLCGVAVGCFADPDFPAPTFSLWEESLHPWLGCRRTLDAFRRGSTPTSSIRCCSMRGTTRRRVRRWAMPSRKRTLLSTPESLDFRTARPAPSIRLPEWSA